jgi:hypothetical protein
MTGAPMRAFVRLREGLEAPELYLGETTQAPEPIISGSRISAARL